MTQEVVVPFGASPSDQATLLLAAAEDLDLPASVVRTSEGAFVVPQEVYDKAFDGPEPETPNLQFEEPGVEPAQKKKSTRKK